MYLYVPLYQAILKYETTKNNIPGIWLRSIENWSYHIKENALFYNATKVLKDVLISFKSYSAINNFIKCKKPYFFVKKKNQSRVFTYACATQEYGFHAPNASRNGSVKFLECSEI
jgi:hypothetical protein